MNPIQFDPELLQYLPTWYKPIQEYQQLCQTESQELELLAEAMHTVKDNFYFQTMTESGVEEWEQMFGIVPNPSTEDLEFRRARVLNRISTKPPFTLGFLYRKLDELIGPGEWTVTVDYPNYTLYIESAAQNFNYATEVTYTVNRIKPAHIAFVQKPFVQSGLLLSETISGALRDYNYVLGSWQLGVLPFAVEEDMGVLKLPTTPSVQPPLLSGVAGFVLGDIAAARINGAIVVNDVSKTQEGALVTVTYPVSSSLTDEILQAELLDSAGNVLTSSAIYVAVGPQPVIMTHKIPVREGVIENG